jgi:hypothetical protein
MPFAVDYQFDDEKVPAHDWDMVREKITALKSHPNVSIFLGGPGGQLIIEHVKDYGYYVSVFGKGEIQEWLAIDPKQPHEWITVKMAGHESEVPRQVLVSDDIAFAVAERFYEQGDRHGQYQWTTTRSLMDEEQYRG